MGLTQQQVQERIDQGLTNESDLSTDKTTKEIIISNTFTYFNLIFLIITVLLCLVGSFRNLTFLPIVIGNTLIGIIQEVRAKRTLDKMNLLNAPHAIVVRDGVKQKIETEQLVQDDEIILEAGNQICADAVVVEGSVQVNESLLTGEADEVEKNPGDELFSGSFVVSGQCHAELTHVGNESYIAKLSQEAKTMGSGEQSEMIRSINQIVKWVEAENLVKQFEKNEKKHKKVLFSAVDHVSLHIKEGEIVGVLGPNGAGKTTLLRMLGCLMQPTEGVVRYTDGDRIITDQTEIKRQIGYLSGNTKLYGRLSTRELLTIAGNIYGLPENVIQARIEEIAQILSLEDFIDNRIEKLSTGQTQRASISRCLIHSPKLYIFDEPTLGLDIVSSSAIVDFMRAEKERGKAVLYSTHYMEEAELLCDRILMLAHGRVIAEGTLQEIYAQTETTNLRDAFKKLIPAGKEEMS